MNVHQLADHVVKRVGGRRRFIIAIAGLPGVGKSTFAKQLQGSLQTRFAQARVIPMDGFHLDNLVLSELGLLERKGSPATISDVCRRTA